MLAKIDSGSLQGIDALPVQIEVNTGERGELRWVIVGLPDTAVKESQNRVFSALGNSGFFGPSSRTTINLAPGNLRKEGPFYDLPIALAIIAATQQRTLPLAKDFLVAGELSLSGQTRPITGAFNLALLAKKLHKRGLILPKDSAPAAAFVDGVEIYGVESLRQCVDFLSGQMALQPIKKVFSDKPLTQTFTHDFADIKGQRILKRVVEIAVAGNHNLIVMGPPGCGKSMVAKCIPELMPLPQLDEWLEILKIHSACGIDIQRSRPFRAPHHTISDAGLIGGGIIPKPGEISLAHNGVLFLDELPEFRRSVLEMLRQPLEDGFVTIVRSNGKLSFPCKMLLVAALNPCPCGYFGSKQRRCKCSQSQIQKYRARLSGPLLDRMDLQIEVQPVDLSHLQNSVVEESSRVVAERIYKAQSFQLQRSKSYNAYLNVSQIEQFCWLSEQDKTWFFKACEQLHISVRAYHKILKVARTIADLSLCKHIDRQHLMEAMQYRCFDRNWV